MSELDLSDVQGLLRFGYKRMTRATYLLVKVKNAAAAREWLRSAPVTNAATMVPPPTTALQIAFTAPGLKVLGVADAVVAGFSHEFRNGMAQESRSRQLGDVETNDPGYWQWGKPGAEPHLAVMFFGEPAEFDHFVRGLTDSAWDEAFEALHSLKTADLGGLEPFGFRDGISQPQIDWDQRRETPCEQFDYTNIVALGEFLLGYPNEYGKLTERPLLEHGAASEHLLPAFDAPAQRD